MTSLLEREVYNRQNRDPALLYKLSQYIILMQQYMKAVNRARNIADDRESKLTSFMQQLKGNNLVELETKGISKMLQIRGLAVKLAQHLRQSVLLAVNERYRQWQPLFRLTGEKYERHLGDTVCYFCYLKGQMAGVGSVEDMRGSMLTKKLSLFVKEFCLFFPKEAKDSAEEVQSHLPKIHFTVTEIS